MLRAKSVWVWVLQLTIHEGVLDWDKIILKNNVLICHYFENDKNHNFNKIINYINLNPDFSTISEKRTSGGDRMIIKFFKMYSIDSAYSLLEEIIKN